MSKKNILNFLKSIVVSALKSCIKSHIYFYFYLVFFKFFSFKIGCLLDLNPASKSRETQRHLFYLICGYQSESAQLYQLFLGYIFTISYDPLEFLTKTCQIPNWQEMAIFHLCTITCINVHLKTSVQLSANTQQRHALIKLAMNLVIWEDSTKFSPSTVYSTKHNAVCASE